MVVLRFLVEQLVKFFGQNRNKSRYRTRQREKYMTDTTEDELRVLCVLFSLQTHISV